MINPKTSTQKRVLISKILLLMVALFAAWVTSLKPGNILFLVGAAFSMAAWAFFPSLVMGVFWKRANRWGCITGMVAGLGVCLYYMGAQSAVLEWLAQKDDLGSDPANFSPCIRLTFRLDHTDLFAL